MRPCRGCGDGLRGRAAHSVEVRPRCDGRLRRELRVLARFLPREHAIDDDAEGKEPRGDDADDLVHLIVPHHLLRRLGDTAAAPLLLVPLHVLLHLARERVLAVGVDGAVRLVVVAVLPLGDLRLHDVVRRGDLLELLGVAVGHVGVQRPRQDVVLLLELRLAHVGGDAQDHVRRPVRRLGPHAPRQPPSASQHLVGRRQ
mmetsp:Transcript_33324/g.102918  ORF Transcript_33324/g.102918 Transcript_33324/m.102918 type:complete len:200 (-) Transcript_33324:18-617(-)